MKQKTKKIVVLLVVLFAMVVFSKAAMAVEYNITQSVDFTGPYAVIMPGMDVTAKIYFAWWNEEVGEKLGVKLTRKSYDTRYDPALTASLWPGILTGDKPILHMGLGGPDVAALMKRLPNDKVPLLMSTGTYGFIWLPNQWVFQFRPTYVHEGAGFFNWVHQNLIKDRPIRIGMINSKASPAYVDAVNGTKVFCKATPWAEFAGVEWVKVKPISLVSEVRRLAKKKPDYIHIMTNTYHGLGTIKALKELGLTIPVILASHNGIQNSVMACKDINVLEGHYDTYAFDAALDMSVPGAQIFEKYRKKLGLEQEWNLICLQVATQCAVAFKAIERAIQKVGTDNLTGEAVYNAFYSGTFTEEDLLGLAPAQSYTTAAPFSEKDPKVKCTTVKNGKQVMVGDGWIPIPPVPKWVKK
ncbi:MAG: ABC transporter substrate-binding protein [Desulfatiglans sp.]|jgi:branched-chain amino acid transport system substrate-binding protein|nr:ABC transporter substrate-binding protein [Thermodesulfobacteriota bacterium]MEE4353098.1 ABC transporter substrate-binding protein [Desulfatiglans sp.]